MNEAEMIGVIVLASVTILGFLTAIIKPIIDLNKSITQLIASVDRLVEEQRTQDNRIETHGKEIDGMKLIIENHETRIDHIEKMENK